MFDVKLVHLSTNLVIQPVVFITINFTFIVHILNLNLCVALLTRVKIAMKRNGEIFRKYTQIIWNYTKKIKFGLYRVFQF